MDNDLNRSLRILEDALATSSRGLIKIGTPKSLRESLHSTVVKDPDEDASQIFNASLSGKDKTITGSVIRAVEPWKIAIDSLYMEFLEILQANSNENNVLQIVSDLAQCCSDTKNVVDELKSKVAVSHISPEDKWLELERNTWRLLYILYQDRLATLANKDADAEIPQYFGTSEKLCILNLFKRESLIRESQLVIDWLEFSAAEKDDEVLHFSDRSVGWENTLHQIRSRDTIVFKSMREIIKTLDPDAPHYQRLGLHDLDVADEERLVKKMFWEIRCGKLEEAQKLCVHCGHAWRATQLEGWRLFHDPNLENDSMIEEDRMEDDSSDLEVIRSNAIGGYVCEETEGNATRDIWKITCLKYCDKPGLNKYEKAAIASYCGYLKPLLVVCNNWEDALWAYMRVMVDIRVESEIRDYVDRQYKSLPDFYWDQKQSLNEIFACIEASKNPSIQKEAKDIQRIIQKHIILDEIPELLAKLEEWIEIPETSVHFRRFAAHLIMFLEQIGQANRKHVDKIVESYVKQLMEMRETQLVTYYISKLNVQNQVHFCAMYFENITENEERKEALLCAEESGLNTMEITKQIVENIRNKPHDLEEVRGLQKKTTPLDARKISALDWLLFYDSQRAEAIRQGNALVHTFLTLGKLDAAQLAFGAVPADSADLALAEPSDEAEQAVKEHLGYKAYLDAHEAFDAWFRQHGARPRPPGEVPPGAGFTEKVAHQHLVSQYKAETERWKLQTAHLAKTARTTLYNVLLFPDGGWLSGAKDGDFLRSLCIPEVVLLLYSVLYESELYAECVQLADILASEKYELYKVYSKEKLQEILVKLCDSSVALLHKNKDPLGSD